MRGERKYLMDYNYIYLISSRYLSCTLIFLSNPPQNINYHDCTRVMWIIYFIYNVLFVLILVLRIWCYSIIFICLLGIVCSGHYSRYHLIEIKLIIDSFLPMTYCVHVHNTFSFFVRTHYFISSNNHNSSSVPPK